MRDVLNAYAFFSIIVWCEIFIFSLIMYDQLYADLVDSTLTCRRNIFVTRVCVFSSSLMI